MAQIKAISWEELYENYIDWPPEKLRNRIAGLTGYGPGDELLEVLSELEEPDADALVSGALIAGVRFSPEELSELSIDVSQPVLDRAAELSSGTFSPKELRELELLLSEEVFLRICRCRGWDPDSILLNGTARPEPEIPQRAEKKQVPAEILAGAWLTGLFGKK